MNISFWHIGFRRSARLALPTAALVVALIAAWTPWSNKTIAAVAGSPTTAMPASTGDEEVDRFSKNVSDALMAQDFATLEAIYAENKSGVAHFLGGLPRLLVFYQAVIGLPDATDKWRPARGNISDQQFNDRRALLEAWGHAMPHSVPAELSLAMLWGEYAWAARSHEYAGNLTEEQLDGYKARVSQEIGILKELPHSDPEVFTVILGVQRDLSASRSEIDEVYTEAIRRFPTYFPLYMVRASTFELKWGGAPGELAQYSQSLLGPTGDNIGQIAYSFVVIQETIGSSLFDVFKDNGGLKWPETKAAFEARQKEYGLSNDDWNMLLLLASSAPDQPSSKLILDHISAWAPSIWVTKRQFDMATAWAVGG